jgi:predicted RNase H-like HicB family nuclease
MISYAIKLEFKLRRDGRDWLAWCPAIDVMTQAKTRKAAVASLREAIELWVESCIERKVLDKALEEAGFQKAKVGEQAPSHVNVMNVVGRLRGNRAVTTIECPRVSRSRRHTREGDYIEVSIPAYIAAQQLADFARAPS